MEVGSQVMLQASSKAVQLQLVTSLGRSVQLSLEVPKY